MKATLEFNLPEDSEEFELQTNAAKYYLALRDIKDLFRGRAKYQETNVEMHEEVYELICSILNGRGIDL